MHGLEQAAVRAPDATRMGKGRQQPTRPGAGKPMRPARAG